VCGEQHLTSLLAAPDPDVVAATLQALVAFVRKTHVSSVRWHGNTGLNDRLLALSQGWGGKEEARRPANALCVRRAVRGAAGCLGVACQSDHRPAQLCASLSAFLLAALAE